MFKLEKKAIIFLYSLLFINAIFFTSFGWKVDGFDFTKLQSYQLYFQSWVSTAGFIFSLIMSLTSFYIYKKNKLPSLTYIGGSFFLSALSYAIIGYHTSYCKVCSDLSLCGASHNYPNYIILIALIISVLTILLTDMKKNVLSLKIFAFGLILASTLLLLTLFISLNFIETPDLLSYVFSSLNFQGLVFVFPLIFVGLSFVYFKTRYKLSKATSFIFILLVLSLLPQIYHMFICTECDNMECSEFYALSGFIMFIAIGFLLYALNLQLKEQSI